MALLRIDLSQLTGIAVTGRAQLDLGVEVAEVKLLYICQRGMGHISSLNQKMTFASQNLYAILAGLVITVESGK